VLWPRSSTSRSLRLPRLICLLALFISGRSLFCSDASIHSPRTEYLRNPEGIDVLQPRLSWQIQASAQHRGWKQSAYRILVASSPALLAQHRGDVWDSGKVASEQSVQVPYAGAGLLSFGRYWWMVRSWDEHDVATTWSERAMWSMGVLSPSEWKGQWIESPQATVEDDAMRFHAASLSLKGAQWITPAERRDDDAVWVYERRIVVPSALTWAAVETAATGDTSVFVNGIRVGGATNEDNWPSPVSFDLREKFHAGENTIAIVLRRKGSSRAPGLLAHLYAAPSSGGKDVSVVSDRNWSAAAMHRVHAPGADTLPASIAWRSAAEAGPAILSISDNGNWRVLHTPEWGQRLSSPTFRKEFSARKPIAHASVVVCGLGYYELHLNGHKVGDHVLDPGYTQYNRRLQYVTYDVTEAVKRGANAISVMLGNGWYNVTNYDHWEFQRARWRATPKLRLNLRIEYTDGTVDTVATDGTWKASRGPVLYDGIRNGEVYDARLEQAGWDSVGFRETKWRNAQIAADPDAVLTAQMAPPVRVTETRPAVSVHETSPGVFLFDMGQNMAGWVRLHMHGPPGGTVTLRYLERVEREDHNAVLEFQGPFGLGAYTLKGGREEVWEPRFTYYGFRYVEVTGYPGKPALAALEARVVQTDFPNAGEFTSSDPLFNRIQQMTRWSYRSNFVGIPTDCPHREKNGWTGDAQMAAETGLMNFDTAAAYAGWIEDVEASQQADGDLPGFVPAPIVDPGDGPAWGGALVLVPWDVYLYDEDERILTRHYASMKRYLQLLELHTNDGVLADGLGDFLPDRPSSLEIKELTSTAYLYTFARKMAVVARLTRQSQDATAFDQLAAATEQAFLRRFQKTNGVYGDGSQVAQSTALYLHLAPVENRRAAVAALVRAVHAKQDHLDVGALGARFIFHALTEGGEQELAATVASQTTFPGYGYWTTIGLTTLAEEWTGAYSRNHIFLGDISSWFYQTIGGIAPDPERPGFHNVIVHPQMPRLMRSAQAEHTSLYGLVRVRSERSDGRLSVDVTVPANTTASVMLRGRGASIEESGASSLHAAGLVRFEQQGKEAIYQIGSGEYHFTVAEQGSSN